MRLWLPRTQQNTSRSWWKVVLDSGRELHEVRTDWALDLVATGDVRRVVQLWLLAPDGREAMLPITEPGTAFQLHTRTLDAFGANANTLECQVIGRVVDKVSGACDCFVWDRLLYPAQGLFLYKSSVYRFGTWHERLAPIGALSQEVQGLRL